MFCMKCQQNLEQCTCPDLDERLRNLNRPGGHVFIPACPNCGNLKPRCTCKPQKKEAIQ
jgi:hypothetical protein